MTAFFNEFAWPGVEGIRFKSNKKHMLKVTRTLIGGPRPNQPQEDYNWQYVFDIDSIAVPCAMNDFSFFMFINQDCIISHKYNARGKMDCISPKTNENNKPVWMCLFESDMTEVYPGLSKRRNQKFFRTEYPKKARLGLQFLVRCRHRRVSIQLVAITNKEVTNGCFSSYHKNEMDVTYKISPQAMKTAQRKKVLTTSPAP